MRQDVVGAVIWLVLSGTALGQTLTQGNTLYQRGDFAGAETALASATKNETGEAKAKAFKLLGICQYMLGKKSQASESFQRAAKLKPGIQIAASEVLDDSVIGFFNSTVATAAPAPAKASTPIAGAKVKKGTFLKVQTTPAGATILLDGIIAGAGGSPIEVDAGQVEIEVQSKGYVSQRAKVNVLKDKENVVTIALQKPKPKPMPKPPKPKAPVMVADKGRKPGKTRKPKADDEMFVDPGEEFMNPASDPAAEFERETQAGYPQAPQGYAQAPQGAQLAYTPNGQPVYIVVPQGAYAQAPSYSPPPPPAPPGYGEESPYMPPPAVDPAAPADPVERPGASAKASGSKNNLLITLLPFGAGQFQNGSYLLGSAFLATEAYAVYYYVSTQPKVTKDTNERNAFVKDKNDKGEDFSEEDKAYVEKADKAIKANKQNMTYAQAGFGALWAIGVIQALATERDPTPAKDKKARKQRRYGGFSYVVPDGVDVAPLLSSQKAGGFGEGLSLDLRWEF